MTEHVPEDMVVTVEAVMTIGALQAELAKRGQWLPIDPPNPDRLTIGDLINTNASGPRRFGYGTIRDFLIGIEMKLADGTIIKSGGKVVKNVAGYDLAKLFIGGRGTLGTVVSATFKLRPLPESERFVEMQCASLDQASQKLGAILESELVPTVFDLHQLEPARPSRPVLMLGFAGTREEVEWQIAKACQLGVKNPSSLEYEKQFWSRPAVPHHESVLPSKLIEAIHGLKGTGFVARAGNGIIYYRGASPPAKQEIPTQLMKRLKEAFDPKHILPDLPL